MKVYIMLIIIVIVIAFISTLLVAGKGDESYDKSTRKNVTRLTLIYAITILASLIVLFVYIFQVI